MDEPDGQVPTPRRPALPRRRRTTPTGLPFGVPAQSGPRAPALSDLLADIDALRLTLQTDLSLAAAALDAGADELAGELVEGDLAEVRAFAGRANDRLALLEQGGDEVVLPAAGRRRIMSAAPLMAAAAALIGFVAFVPDRAPNASPDTTMTSAVMASYELSRLAQQGAPDEELRSVAEELNAELAELVAQAAEDPAAAQQALYLLETTTQVLSSQGDSGVLRGVIAETRALRQRLRAALPVSTSAVRTTARKVARPVVPVLPRVQEEPEKERAAESPQPTSSPKASSSPKPSPTPSPSATTASPAPAPSPTGSPDPDPDPEPSSGPPGPLPDGGDDDDVPDGLH